MRRRYQKGCLQLRKQGGVWVWLGKWREGEHHRTKTLGQKSEMTKTEAQVALNEVLGPLNARQEPQTGRMQIGDFIRDLYYPFCRRKWKRSTRMTTEQRIDCYLVPEIGEMELRSIGRIALLDLLDRKAAAELSFGVVTHLRFDLRQIFRLAVAEGFIERNPAELLFTPRTAKLTVRRVATVEQVAQVFGLLDHRERLIFKLGGIAGMRPGEIFGLKWVNLEPPYADIRRRVYHGDIDTPKSHRSIRKAALSEGLVTDVSEWRASSLDTSPDAWVFPSESGKTPLRTDNVWHRHIGPKLKAAGLEWINFQVLRRSCSSIMGDNGIDPKVASDQLGHTLDVNQNVYTRAAFDRQEDAVNRLDQALRVN